MLGTFGELQGSFGEVGLFRGDIGLFCGDAGLFCRVLGMFRLEPTMYMYVYLCVCGCVGVSHTLSHTHSLFLTHTQLKNVAIDAAPELRKLCITQCKMLQRVKVADSSSLSLLSLSGYIYACI